MYQPLFLMRMSCTFVSPSYAGMERLYSPGFEEGYVDFTVLSIKLCLTWKRKLLSFWMGRKLKKTSGTTIQLH